MATVPAKRIDRVQFYEDHITPWTTNATAIGLTSAEVTDIGTKAAAARTAYNAQQSAKQAAEAATEAFYNSVSFLTLAGDLAIVKIKNKALTTGNPNVYALAQIPPPSTPASKGSPGTPRDFKVELTNTGGLLCKWKNSNASGSTYQVYRRLGTTGAFTMFAGLARKTFTDNTVPPGTAVVQYQIQAVRPSGVSEWALFNVNLGSAAQGLPMVTESTSPVKIAA